MNIKTYHTNKSLEETLSKTIALILKIAIEKFGFANLLVSGGNTPKNLFLILSKEDIEWKNVNIGLVDERYVNSNHEKSNERMVKENLLINNAVKAKLFGLVYNLDDYEENLKVATKIYKVFHSRIDVCLLGMGTDGHTASLFPNDEKSKQGLSLAFHALLNNTNAIEEPIKRISCTRFLMYKSENLFLMINGLEKMNVLQSAKTKSLPIAVFFETPKTELDIYYCQN
jgi:6-phosphogluconolactonase